MVTIIADAVLSAMYSFSDILRSLLPIPFLLFGRKRMISALSSGFLLLSRNRKRLQLRKNL